MFSRTKKTMRCLLDVACRLARAPMDRVIRVNTYIQYACTEQIITKWFLFREGYIASYYTFFCHCSCPCREYRYAKFGETSRRAMGNKNIDALTVAWGVEGFFETPESKPR